jgi:glucokinase
MNSGDATSGVLLALDFGGTKLAAGIADPATLEWRDQGICVTPTSGAESRDAIVSLAHPLLHRADDPVVGVGVSFGGPVDSAGGRIVRSMHVPGWDGYPLAAELATLFGAPARIANDARAGALGEWRFGTGGARGSLFYLTVSTGVGGGLVIDGAPVDGASGLAGEVGHLTVDANGPPCSCGRRGCVEAFASGPAIAREASRRVAADMAGSPNLAARLTDPAGLTGKDVADAATTGDRLAAELMTAAGSAAGLAVASVIAVVNPDVVAVGGGVAKSGAAFWESLLATAQREALPTSTKILPAKLVDTAPLAGALVLAQRAARERSHG